MRFLNRLPGRASKNSRFIAKTRLQKILAHDHANVSPALNQQPPAKRIKGISTITAPIQAAGYQPMSR